jgi:hypothetical protein
MSFFCPNCGTEVDSGNRCPECGHVDEQCSDCDQTVGGSDWFCRGCGTARRLCPECGARLSDHGCERCGADRPHQCESCGSGVSPEATRCDDCGHEYASGKARTAKLVAIGFPILYTAFIVYQNSPGLFFTISNAPFAFATVMALPFVFVALPALFLSRRWQKQAGTETISEPMASRSA